ncbi:MAG: DNA double-strand break repair nuclease NurA [Acidobacteria bacterium]|jgi:hypothetical protein|nr:MAG: DNA double-strand break repair nuclease NurA [Acidobacteriota bacterium]GIU81065.1 MAG: hypothetical protein KatS3mg006_0129 [Pyrinomonadaceae bacterium]
MLDPTKINEELCRRKIEIEEFFNSNNTKLANYKEILDKISKMPYESLRKLAQECEVIPSDEHEKADKLVIKSDGKWKNPEQLRKWAIEVLRDRVTFGVDGSQSYFHKELNFPIAILQVGWFKNFHTTDSKPEKNSELSLLTPKEILKNQNENISAESYVGQRRFAMEVEKTKEFLKSKRNWGQQNEKMPVAFFDGAFLISLAKREIQENLSQSVIELVKLSAETKVPVVGYIDRSYSYDLSSLFALFDKDNVNKFSMDNATLIEALSLLESFGDRTIFFHSKRKDLKNYLQEAPTGFAYLKVNSSLPVRLDIPTWIFEEGQLDEVIEVVLAECVVGNGYPYPLSVADQIAFITNQDKTLFLETLIKNFSSSSGAQINLSFSRKPLSKKFFRSP